MLILPRFQSIKSLDATLMGKIDEYQSQSLQYIHVTFGYSYV